MLSTITNSIERWVGAGLDFLAPPKCLGCHVPLDEFQFSISESLCSSCRDQIFPLPDNYCVRCGAPVGPHVDIQNGCYHCQNDSFAFESVISLDAHKGLLRELCIRSKKSANPAIAKYLWSILFEKDQKKFSSWDIDTVIAVPSHWSDRMRMQNVAPEEIALQAGRSLRVPVSRNILRKRRRTAKQSSLTPTERRKNLRGVFKVVGKSKLSGLNILIVDDILTTGSTCHEVAKSLRNAGANQIYVAVFGRGIGEA